MPEGPREILSLDGVGVDFETDQGSRTVLDSLDLWVFEGEFISILGPSGSGKTTLLRVINGLEAPTRGRIAWRGEPSMALVFQKALLLPWRTVLDNATFALECRGERRSEGRDRTVALLERMGLGDHLHHHPHELSGGMQQRVDLARALLLEPRVLLMDEPFGSLDVDTSASLQALLLEMWAARHFTVVFVSHALSEVVALSDRVALLAGSPSRITRVETVDLSRPRGADEAGQVALVRRAAELARWYTDG